MSRRLLHWLGYTIFLVGFVLLGVEVLVRAFDPIGIEYVYEAQKYFAFMERREDYAYRHKPHLQEILQGTSVRTNSEGFRGPEFSVDKPEGTYRIVLLGDSVVFGWGVEEQDDLPRQLERALPQTTVDGRRVEIVPVAVGSWNTRVHYAFYAARGHAYSPDAIAWVIVSNDIEPKRHVPTLVPADELFAYQQEEHARAWYDRGRALDLRRWLSQHSHAVATFERLFLTASRAADDYSRMLEPDSPQARDAMDALEKLVQSTRADGVPMVAFLHGSMLVPWEREFIALYRTRLSALDVPVETLPEEIYTREMTNSFVDHHQNERGIQVMAQFIAKHLVSHLDAFAPAAP